MPRPAGDVFCECGHFDCHLQMDGDDWLTIRYDETLFPTAKTHWTDRKSIYHPDCTHIPSDAVKFERGGRILGWVGS